MLELSALGLLQKHPLHGYRLKQELELFMGSCISVNYGAIYPLLRRLQEQGNIAAIAPAEDNTGLSRRIYQITPKGRDRWHEKMLEHPPESWVNSRSRFAIKCFFFSELTAVERIKLIEHRRLKCCLLQAELEDLSLPNDPYQSLLWEHHLALLQAEIDWLDQLLTRELHLAEAPTQRSQEVQFSASP
ncbi:MAG: PadR family transcriptional regulator [Desertifilum sp.]|nr:PadR family transcriptional regulator [Desertifilum sp.]